MASANKKPSGAWDFLFTKFVVRLDQPHLASKSLTSGLVLRFINVFPFKFTTLAVKYELYSLLFPCFIEHSDFDEFFVANLF